MYTYCIPNRSNWDDLENELYEEHRRQEQRPLYEFVIEAVYLPQIKCFMFDF